MCTEGLGSKKCIYYRENFLSLSLSLSLSFSLSPSLSPKSINCKTLSDLNIFFFLKLTLGYYFITT